MANAKGDALHDWYTMLDTEEVPKQVYRIARTQIKQKNSADASSSEKCELISDYTPVEHHTVGSLELSPSCLNSIPENCQLIHSPGISRFARWAGGLLEVHIAHNSLMQPINLWKVCLIK